MSSKILSIERRRHLKLHSEKLKRKYTRERREQNELSPDFVNTDLIEYYPLPLEKENLKYCVTKEAPFCDFELVHEIELDHVIQHFNSLLIYRILKLMYGPADIVAAFIDMSQLNHSQVTVAGGAGIDWSYILRLNNVLVAEIRSLFNNTRQLVRYWSDKVPINEKSRKDYGATMAEFLGDLEEAVSQNFHLFKEEEEINRSNVIAGGFQNIFAVKYSSGKHLLELAESLDTKPRKVLLKFGENPEIQPVGSLFTAASLYFCFALEALLNVFYELFLYDEYRAETYRRVTTHADLDVRVLTINLFCHSFRRQAVSKNSSCLNNLRLLRDFRNNMVHGNLTDEHRVYDLAEDWMQFFYFPSGDFRGEKAERLATKKLPLFMPYVDKHVALRIKKIVDDIVQRLLHALNPETGKWVEGWLNELVVPAAFPEKKESSKPE